MTASPGLASGRMSRQNVPNGVRPSTCPDSSISRGMVSKKPYIIQAQNGTEMVRYVMTRPAGLLRSPMPAMML